jgi:mono/diheme cytochrome c family protein
MTSMPPASACGRIAPTVKAARKDEVSMTIASRVLLPQFLIALALYGATSVAHGQTKPSIARGQEVAQRTCAGCHALEGQQGITVQGVVVPTFRAIANLPNRTPERLEAFIMTPHRPMPATPLELAEVRDVVAYILSLKQ